MPRYQKLRSATLKTGLYVLPASAVSGNGTWQQGGCFCFSGIAGAPVTRLVQSHLVSIGYVMEDRSIPQFGQNRFFSK